MIVIALYFGDQCVTSNELAVFSLLVSARLMVRGEPGKKFPAVDE